MAYDHTRKQEDPQVGDATPRRRDDRSPAYPRSHGRDVQPPSPGAPATSRPAHPLPEFRSGALDYDRYLERSTDKFKIFSAGARRRRNRAIATAVAIAAVVVIVVAWAIMSRPA